MRHAFEAAISALSAAGVGITSIPLESTRDCARAMSKGGVIGYEAYRQHRQRLARAYYRYDPLIDQRLLKAAEIPEARYRAALGKLSGFRAKFDREIGSFDAFVLPTVPILPPRLEELGDNARYLAINGQSFSLTEYASRLDLPSISLPIGERPIGFMLTGRRGSDAALLALAERLEPTIRNAV